MKNSLKKINSKYNLVVQRYHERFVDELIEERKERQLERSIFVINEVLKAPRKRNGDKLPTQNP